MTGGARVAAADPTLIALVDTGWTLVLVLTVAYLIRTLWQLVPAREMKPPPDSATRLRGVAHGYAVLDLTALESAGGPLDDETAGAEVPVATAASAVTGSVVTLPRR